MNKLCETFKKIHNFINGNGLPSRWLTSLGNPSIDPLLSKLDLYKLLPHNNNDYPKKIKR